MSLVDKAKIFYNHLYFNEIDDERFSTIRESENYYQILGHKNYNPRIVEFVTRKDNYSKHKPRDYFKYVIGSLENPKDIWADEFNNRLRAEDRVFMYCLYSLTNQSVDIDILQEVFKKRLSCMPNIDTTKNVFEDTLKRLSESLVRIIDNYGKKMISVANPSINDYISEFLKNNELECDDIVGNALYFEQYINILPKKYTSEEVTELFVSGKIMSVKTVNNSIEYYYLRTMKENPLLGSITFEKKAFVSALEKLRVTNINVKSISKLLIDIFHINFIENNDLLKDILNGEAIITILQHLTREDCEGFGELIFRLIGSDDDLHGSFSDDLYDQLQDKYISYINEQMSDKTDDICRRAENSVDKFDFDEDYSPRRREDLFVSEASEVAESIFEEELKEIIDKIFPVYVGDNFSLSGTHVKDSVDGIDFEDLIRKRQRDDYYSDYLHDQYKDNKAAEKFNKDIIDNIFAKRGE